MYLVSLRHAGPYPTRGSKTQWRGESERWRGGGVRIDGMLTVESLSTMLPIVYFLFEGKE